MKRRLIVLVFSLTLLLTCCQKPAAPSPAGSAGAWRGVTSVAGRFTVELPGEPQEDTVQADMPAGKVDVHSWNVRTSASLLTVAWTEHPVFVQTPAKTREMLQTGKEGGLAKARARLVSEAALPPVVAGGDPGLEIIHQSSDGKIRGRHRSWFAGGRLYQLSAVSDATRPEPEEVGRFIASFRVEGM